MKYEYRVERMKETETERKRLRLLKEMDLLCDTYPHKGTETEKEKHFQKYLTIEKCYNRL